MLAAACFLSVVLTAPAAAHETQAVGPLRLSVGWAEEPALAGVPNAIEVVVTDSAGTPVNEPAATLTVDVTFGAEKVMRTLGPAGTPGRFESPVIPTRAGTYAFRVHGAVRGTNVDITSTCSDRTFECVKNPGELQFPAKDPSTGELAARLDREAARLDKKASDRDPLAIVALALACAALVVGGVAIGRGARTR